MKRVHIKFVVALAVAMACGGVAQASNWVGGGIDNEFSTTNNWDDFGINGTQNINGDFTVERVVDNVAARTFVQGGAILNVTGGNHNDSQSGASIYNFVGNSSVGTVNQSGGTYQIGHSLRIGSNNANADGTYSLTDGFLSVYRGSNSAIDSSNPGGRPSIEVGGLTLGMGLFEISGGAMETRGGVHVGGTGIFSVKGSAATSIGIGSNGSGDGAWLSISNATIRAAVDGGGLTPIFVDDTGGGTILAEFRGGSLLDLGFDGIAPLAGTWTLMEVENTAIADLGLGLSGTTAAGWSFKVDNSGANGLLTVSYIPEPSTLALTLIAGLVAVRARRRK